MRGWGVLLLGTCGATLTAAAPLTVSSEPAGAVVSLDGEDVGLTPVTLELPDQMVSHWLRVSADGYTAIVMSFTAVPQRPQGFHFVLTPAEGQPQGEALPPSAGVDVAKGTEWRAIREGEAEPFDVAAQNAALAELRAAVERFRADCGEWPKSLAHLALADPTSLTYLSAQARTAFRGPYLAALPVDPATGHADWLYDAISGRVGSRGGLPAAAPVSLSSATPTALPAGDDALRAFVQALLRATGAVPR